MNVLDEGWIPPGPSGVAVGVFDGVHKGHAAVIGTLVDRCRSEGWQTGVMSFDPHPVSVLAPEHAPALLTTVERRVELLHELGVDWVGFLDLRQIREMLPGQFAEEILVDRGQARLVSVGSDFRFGRDRAGDVVTLEKEGNRLGFEVAAIDLVADSSGVVSSTRIRSLLAQGDVTAAASLLGRPHRLSGEVIRGEARGRELGFPTANLAIPEGLAVPADGIYAVRVAGGVEGIGVASLGVRPTFGPSGERLLETFVFDFAGDLYGRTLHVDFVARLRGEERFDSVEALVRQMEDDARQAREILSS